MIDPNQLTLGFAVGKMKAIEVSASSVASSAHCNFRTDETAHVVLPDRLQPQFLPKTTDSITETVSSLLNDHNCKSTVSGGTKMVEVESVSLKRKTNQNWIPEMIIQKYPSPKG